MKNKSSALLYYFSFANLIFGAKLWLIGKFGSQLPFWDQWNEEGERLYKHFLKGDLAFSYFFSLHSEHRILTTRLLDLAELVLNGIWNPLLQMSVNALLHVAALVVVVALLARALGRKDLPALLAFTTLLFALPNGWENTLCGFQAQVYFVTLFSAAGLWWTTLQEPFSSKWCGGLTCLVLSFFSMASGIFCSLAAGLTGSVFYLSGLRRTPRQFWAVSLLAVVFISEAGLTVHFGAADPGSLRAGSMAQFLNALFHALAWPAPNRTLGILQNLPALAFIPLMAKWKPPANDPRWFLLALLFCLWGIDSGIAYGRALCPVSSRYTDFFSILILVLFSCLLLIAQKSAVKWKALSYSCFFLWLLVVAVCLQIYNARPTQKDLKDWKETQMVEEINTKNYVATRDMAWLKNKPLLDIPFPSADLLASYLDDPEIRKILPSDIAPADRPVKEGRFDRFVNALLAHYRIFMALGLLAAVAGAGLGWFFPPGRGADRPERPAGAV